VTGAGAQVQMNKANDVNFSVDRTGMVARLLLALLAGLAWLIGGIQPAAAKQDFLPPEKAYRYTVAPQRDRIVVVWTIEPGYYLYKKKMAVASTLPTVKLGEPEWPKGESHTDEYFGTQEIYRGTVTVPVPFTIEGGADPRKVPLELRLQGCADAGLCFPPLRWKTEADLPSGADRMKRSASAQAWSGPIRCR
jgi:thioredoxin:protein disulfide reductase